MPRPFKKKTIGFRPEITYFKPRAVPLNQLEEVEITFDELETLRLSNIEKLSQNDAAEIMGVHQSTFQRTLSRAREKVTKALVKGMAIKINGGEYEMFRGTAKRGGRIGQFMGPGGVCVCTECGHEVEHLRGQPCNSRTCPKCGSQMARG